jgi:hypothetical protein
MNTKAQTIWKAFCGELIVEPTDDMREALATAFRICGGLSWDDEDMRPSWEILEELADELEDL